MEFSFISLVWFLYLTLNPSPHGSQEAIEYSSASPRAQPHAWKVTVGAAYPQSLWRESRGELFPQRKIKMLYQKCGMDSERDKM